MKQTKEFEDWVIEIRRHFHRFPELSFQEKETQRKIMEILKSLDIQAEPIADTGLIATVKGIKQGKTLAIRADMDALNIDETPTDLNKNYRSLNEGVMHACGHDGHMAMVLGAARLLSENRNELNGNVRLIFQPGEEVPPGGAIRIIKEGGLEGVDAIIGMHLFTNYPSGKFLVNTGAMMAGNCSFHIEITGKSGHHANPELTIDPILIASEFISHIRSRIKQSIKKDAFVFGIGTINGGKQFNHVPDSVSLSGSFRAFSLTHLKQIEQEMQAALNEITERYATDQLGLPSYELKVNYGYPVLVNHSGFARQVTALLEKEYPRDTISDLSPVFASEDFAHYLSERPGVFLFLGAVNSYKSSIYFNHSSCFDIDETVLSKGAAIFYTVAKNFLDNSTKYLIK